MAFLLLLKTSVPHPFRFFLRKGWDANEFQVYAISENARAGTWRSNRHTRFRIQKGMP
jgi:hypothetical protein